MSDNATISTPNQFLNGQGASRLAANGMDINALRTWTGEDGNSYQTVKVNGKEQAIRTNVVSLLRKDEWISYDTRVTAVAQQRLVIAADLVAAGLSRNLGGLGAVMAEWERVDDSGPAAIDMSGTTESAEDRVGYDLDGVPVPIIHKGFRLNIRYLSRIRQLGQPLDTANAEAAARKVATALENMLINGATITVQGRPIYGLNNHPSRITFNIGDLTAGTNENYVTQILTLLNRGELKGFFGPFNLYVPASHTIRLGNDFKANSALTLLQRLQAIPQINAVKVSDLITLPTLVQLSRDTIELGIAQDITTAEWETKGPFESEFRVFGAMVPMIRTQQNERDGTVNTGIIVGTTS